ncbi:MAG: hypothetical protein ABI688_00615 [Bacteroidota bacterium]
MKRSLKRLAIFPVVMLFCITQGLFSASARSVQDRFSNTATEETSLGPAPAVYADFALHTTNALSSPGNSSTTGPGALKNSVTGSAAYAEITAQSFRREFVQYSFYMRNLLLRLRAREIIFPFHYFW